MNTDLSDVVVSEPELQFPDSDQTQTVNWLKRKFPEADDKVISAATYLLGIMTESTKVPMKYGQVVAPADLRIGHDETTLINIRITMKAARRNNGRIFLIESPTTNVCVNDAHTFYLNCVRLIDFLKKVYN